MTLLTFETIPIHDNGEPLVDLASYPFVIEPMYYHQGYSLDPIVRARKDVADKLLNIQESFDGKYRFKIWDAHRPRIVQDAIYTSFREKIVQNNPNYSDEHVDNETQLYVTKALDPNRIPPHATGGTLDLTLVDENGAELNMGTKFDHFGKEATPGFFKGKDEVINTNRQLLADAMTNAGFTAHDDEWWHFDYGNQVWALKANVPLAIYGEAFIDHKH